MRNILGDISESIKERWGEIIIGTVFIIILILTLPVYDLTFENINGDDNNNKKEMDSLEVIYEGYTNKFDMLCKDEDLEKVCADLGSGVGKRAACNVAKCCVWVKNKDTEECVEGDEDGPMIKEDNQNNKYDEYYYLNKKYKMK
tara:strand:- start:162 stop:593 length:432 start_codon:yes stop_codon:yes gene_type:complete